jgi:hypothetical protein
MRAAAASAITPPSERPSSHPRSTPAASSTAESSTSRSSSDAGAIDGSDNPVPSLSYCTQRNPEARRMIGRQNTGCSHIISMC